MFAIVGSGFGLYGYLPAVAESFGEPVLLPEDYRAKVMARAELRPYLSSIRWAPDRTAALGAADGVVIATPPARQVEVAVECLRLPAIGHMVLEKPLAPDPAQAARLLGELRASGKRFRLGYTLLHTGWAARLRWPAHAEVSITWTFMAHHFAHDLASWKREHASGGGPLRFYGVHLLALLARHGYLEAAESTLAGETAGEPERWEARFTGAGLPDCRVVVDSRCAEAAFRIAAGGAALVALDDPYGGEPAPGEADRRVAVLKRFLASFDAPDSPECDFYERVERLWRHTEDVTRPPRR